MGILLGLKYNVFFVHVFHTTLLKWLPEICNVRDTVTYSALLICVFKYNIKPHMAV